MLRQCLQIIATLTALILFLQVGEWIRNQLSIPLPASIIGMLLLLISLLLWRRVPLWLAQPIEAGLPHLSLLFIPAIAGVVGFAQLSLLTWIYLIVFLCVSWFIGFVIVAKFLDARLGEDNSE